MNSNVDPRLVQAIDDAREDEEVEALVLLDKALGKRLRVDTRGVGGQVIDQVVEEVHQEPSQIKYLPNLGAVYVKASPRLVRQLLERDEVRSASSPEAEFEY